MNIITKFYHLYKFTKMNGIEETKKLFEYTESLSKEELIQENEELRKQLALAKEEWKASKKKSAPHEGHFMQGAPK